MTKRRRLLRIVQPRVQWRLILTIFGVSVLALLLQYVLFVCTLADAAQQLDPGNAEFLLSDTGVRLRVVLLLSVCLLLPTTLLVGILATRRFAGPLYRIESYLRQVVARTEKGPCRLRRGDDLQELCDLVNQATEPLRSRVTTDSSGQTREAA